MKFALGGEGADYINQGVGSIFKALAQAPLVRQQAEEQAALRNAQTYAANMAGNKHGSEAAGNQLTLEQRKGMDNYIASNPDLSPYDRMLALAYKWTGDNNIERLANARGQFQTHDIRDQAVKNVDDPDLMNRLNILSVPSATYQPYKAIGNTGYSVNEATGVQTQASPALAGLHSGEINSRIRVNNAQASDASALAERTKAEADVIRANSALAQNQGSTPDAVQPRENAVIDDARGGLGMDSNKEVLLRQARYAIANGAPIDKVIQRLKSMGVDPSGGLS